MDINNKVSELIETQKRLKSITGPVTPITEALRQTELLRPYMGVFSLPEPVKNFIELSAKLEAYMPYKVVAKLGYNPALEEMVLPKKFMPWSNPFKEIVAIQSQIKDLTFRECVSVLPYVNSLLKSLAEDLTLQRNEEPITEEANDYISIIEEMDLSGVISRPALVQLGAKLDGIFEQLKSVKKSVQSMPMLLMAIIGFILAVKSEIMSWQPKPETVTKEDLLEFGAQLQKQFVEAIVDSTLVGYIKTDCKLLLKPKKKSLIIRRLHQGCRVVIIHKAHKWAYISCTSPLDGLPQTGWVLKKYLLWAKSDDRF
jgi:hypothetical protein